MRTECRAGLEGDFLALPSLSFPWNNSTGIFILRCRCWASTKLLHTALHLGHLANLSHLARLAFEKVLCDGFFFFFNVFHEDVSWSLKESFLSSCIETCRFYCIIQTCTLGSYPTSFSPSSLGKHQVQSMTCAPHFSVPIRPAKTLRLPTAGGTPWPASYGGHWRNF